MRVELNRLDSLRVSDVRHPDGEDEIRALLTDTRFTIGEGRVGETSTKRIKSCQRNILIMSGEEHIRVVGATCRRPVIIGRTLSGMTREISRQAPTRIPQSRQDIRNRPAAAATGIPGLDDGIGKFVQLGNRQRTTVKENRHQRLSTDLHSSRDLELFAFQRD